MTQLPKFQWDVDPVFLRVPREFVIGGLAIFAAISLITGLRKKASDQLVTAAIFGTLAFLAYKYLKIEFELRYYSALFLGVFLGGYSLLKWQIVRGGGRAEDAGDFIVYGVLGVLIGARLGHVIFYDLDKAIADPAWIFKIWTGGLASHGAVMGLILAMWIFTKRRGIPFLEGADRFSLAAALGATLVRVGNWFNSEIVGRKTNQTWGVWFPRVDDVPTYRYPTQLYEITLGLSVLLALYLIDKKLGREKRPRGALIASFFALYFSGRFFIEFFKEYEGIPSTSPLTMGQYLSIPGILIGWLGLYWSFKKRIPVGWPNPYAEFDDADDEDGDEDEEQPRLSRRRRKKSKADKRKRKAAKAKRAKAAAVEEEAKPAEDSAPEDEGDDENEPSEASAEERERADEHEDLDANQGDEEDETEEDDEANDSGDEEGDDEEGDDEEGDDKEPQKPSGDPDVDDEFDAEGKLRRNRGTSDD
ncbi:MAG TPA: prolipoprotein diacylglyceryl transferase [Polyangiaceae bacterium]|nr:prolipoprotein diacylglyceryl transferase [Polyangiaceae bacterium]